MRPWHLGNTTVRSPFRLREGLLALSTSPLQGNLRGTSQDAAFRDLLGERGIVTLGVDETNSVGRKWRSALAKLGFLFPETLKSAGIPQSDVGIVDTITPNGWRLVNADTVPAMQECFLRALAAYCIPPSLGKRYACATFSPLRHTLAVMLELERQTNDSRLNFIEMALVVQLTGNEDALEDIVAAVLSLRTQREAAPNKRRFDQERYEAAAAAATAATKRKYAAQTFNDYADTNLRYLKATGLVGTKGKGISLVPTKHLFIEQLVQDTRIPDSAASYFRTLCEGAELPTDDKANALAVLHDLERQLKSRGISFKSAVKPADTAADIAIYRHRAEALLAERNEEEYALRQAAEWQEIAEYMELIIRHSSKKKLADDIEIVVPKNEAPAYFEWVLWRAFLAINSLVNKPYCARKFKVDQDFLPVCTAPGNGPDMVFEFADFVLAVEVTLTASSRQEAAEGEPVRRHVADLVSKNSTPKPVYGLFIANQIDSNTAETFRIGCWYTKTDDKMLLTIIPLTLAQFRDFFVALFTAGRVEAGLVRGLLDRCEALRAECEAPEWKSRINGTVDVIIKELPAP